MKTALTLCVLLTAILVATTTGNPVKKDKNPDTLKPIKEEKDSSADRASRKHDNGRLAGQADGEGRRKLEASRVSNDCAKGKLMCFATLTSPKSASRAEKKAFLCSNVPALKECLNKVVCEAGNFAARLAVFDKICSSDAEYLPESDAAEAPPQPAADQAPPQPAAEEAPLQPAAEPVPPPEQYEQVNLGRK
jgi:hypothetical protein